VAFPKRACRLSPAAGSLLNLVTVLSRSSLSYLFSAKVLLDFKRL
jgi:hypothetical protein